MLRLFAAIAPPQDVAEGLRALQRGVPGARWSPLANLHVTLRFFGELNPPLARDLNSALAQVSAPAFDLALSGVGAFGEGHQVRTVWAGVEESAPLRHLAGRLEAAARRAGLKPETRAYRPHLTLAYLRDASPDKVAAWVAANNLYRCAPWRVERFDLYSSWLGRDGSAYELERSYPLA